MRLDKFLQTSRIVKRRAVAAQLCDRGRVDVNGRTAKPGKELQVGDRISLRFRSGGALDCEVVELPTRAVRKEQAASLYTVVEDTRAEGERDA